MNLYARDFTEPISDEERLAIQLLTDFDNRTDIRNSRDDPRLSHPNIDIRDFLWHYSSLFPNNSLNPFPQLLFDLEHESSCFEQLLDRQEGEQSVLRYIKENNKWFIPASIYKEYNFGHHGAYIFPEQQLGTEYRADYMLLGRNSDGFHIVLVEFEEPNDSFTLARAVTESESVRKGHTQIRDWKRWFDTNRPYFMQSNGFSSKAIDVPTFRIHYALVVGRRAQLTTSASDLRSQIEFEESNLKIMTYDRLVDNIVKLSNGY